MARALLIAALAFAAGGGCYEPTFDDCTTTCSTSDLCPDGLACTDGYCRIAGATGSCEGHMTSCPPQPPMQCMNTTHVMLEPPNCFAVCAVGGAGTEDFTFNTWHLAILDDADKQQAARDITTGDAVWIALRQTAGQTAVGDGWQWQRNQMTTPLGAALDWAAGQPDDGDGTESGDQQCGAATTNGWIDDVCTTHHAFLIAP